MRFVTYSELVCLSREHGCCIYGITLLSAKDGREIPINVRVDSKPAEGAKCRIDVCNTCEFICYNTLRNASAAYHPCGTGGIFSNDVRHSV